MTPSSTTGTRRRASVFRPGNAWQGDGNEHTATIQAIYDGQDWADLLACIKSHELS